MGAPRRVPSIAAGTPLGPATAVIVVDGVGVIRAWDEGATALIGCPAQEAVGRLLTDVLPPMRTGAHQAGETSLAVRLESERGWEGRQVVRRGDGSRLDLEVKILPVHSPGGPAMRLILAADTTRAWSARASRSLLEGLTRTAPVGMAILDTQLCFTWVNDTMEELCRVPRDGLLGRRPADVLPGLDVVSTQAEICQVLETGIPSSGRKYFGRVQADPKQVAYSTSCFRLETEGGRPLGVCYVVLSTTEHYRAQQKLALLNEARKRMGNTLDVADAAKELADAAVPGLADHVIVDLLEAVLRGEEPPSGPADAATVATLQSTAYRSARSDVPPPVLPGGPSTQSRTARAIASGVPSLIAHVDPTDPHGIADDPVRSAHERRLGIHSLMIVPIRSRGTTLGAATFERSRDSGPFQGDDLELAEELAAHAAVCIDNARRYTHEHAAALALQRSLLPVDLPEQNAVEAAYRYLPADAESGVGGDWFDVVPLSGARVALVVGDVVGHGIHAAATMGRLRAAVQTLADIDLAPDEVLAHVDDMVSRIALEATDPSGVTGATCLYAVYDPVSRHCTLARAGHPAPVLVTPDGEARLVDLPSGPPLGLGGLPFESICIPVPEGSVLALYTDGLIHGPALDTDHGLQHLVDALSTPGLLLEERCEAAVTGLADGRPTDDVALLLARTGALGEEHVACWEIPKDPASVASARAKATRQLTAWGLEDLTFATELVVSELVTNAIRYGSDPVHLRLIHDRMLICEVFDGSSTSPHMRHARTTDEGGRGLFLVAQVAERWGARYAKYGKTVWSEQPLQPAATGQDSTNEKAAQ
ncbi:SpoIIE family protein phosphatase [Streptomyces sp. NBC_01637]|uniref:SpoIIE family protein phosphatase n=1 Tax=unclassified Streptomyces TaxID=2593676 RepID=UPI003862EED3|nr:SpoIIE family protein phosphatase [Streptomyces sp. NBC_01653]WTC84595.1 SpoIIE family protein phosphatase [Streptomyces sp. NBC_01653]WTD86272.1 SpoIIE family protein phosphatase [Streptomyces sp. NBC_01637]WTD94252.1 SpoIIE family protein phosphatase [Streptomyces sp. NBC_01637]